MEEQREVSYEEGQKLAQDYGFKFYETSAKEGDNVDFVFENTVKEYSQTLHSSYRQGQVFNLRAGQNQENCDY